MKWYWIVLITVGLVLIIFKVILPIMIAWYRGEKEVKPDQPPQEIPEQPVTNLANGTAVRISLGTGYFSDTYYWYYGHTKSYHNGVEQYVVRIAHGDQGKNVPRDRVQEWSDFTQDDVSSLEYHTGDDALRFPNHMNMWIKVTAIAKVDTTDSHDMPTYTIVVVDPDNPEKSIEMHGIPVSSLRMFHDSEDATPMLTR
jgi:hypothetical protein